MSPKKPKSSKRKAIPQVLTPEVLEREEDEDLETRDASNDDEDDFTESDEPEFAGDPDQADSSLLPANLETLDPEIKAVSAVSATDPLRRYLEEVRRYSLLTPEEEIKLAIQLKNSGSVDAAKRMVQGNLRLVVKIAFEYRSVYANVMDLIQEGNIGLMKAVSKYDPTKGAKLGYYSSWWIRSYILKYLLDNFRLVKIGTTQAQKKLFFHLIREKERLEAQGLFAGPKLLAQKFEVREKDVIEMDQRLSGSGGEVSLDAPMRPGEENSGSFVDLLRDNQDRVDDRLIHDELLKKVAVRIPEFEKTLNEKEKKLLRERLLAEKPKTLQEVADLYGLTRERVRQIEAKVIQKLKEFLAPDLR